MHAFRAFLGLDGARPRQYGVLTRAPVAGARCVVGPVRSARDRGAGQRHGVNSVEHTRSLTEEEA